MYKQAYTDRVIGVNMSDLAAASHVQYGTKPFKAILFSLFLAGFASFSTLYCVQPMMPILADFFTVTPTQSSFPLSFSTVALAIGLPLWLSLYKSRIGCFKKICLKNGLSISQRLCKRQPHLKFLAFY